MSFATAIEYAEEQDRNDELASFRDRFHIPQHTDGSEAIYLCGHSLGIQPKSTAAILERELEVWRRIAVKGHFEAGHPWVSYHEQLTDMTAELVGARPIEVVNMNTLTVNLHLMMVSFYRPTRERHKLLIEKRAFPSDRYATEAHVRFHGFDPAESLLEVGPREGEAFIRHDDLHELIEREGRSIALILLPGVQYYSGQLFDMPSITRLGHQHGCTVGFDLAHAAGNVPLALHDWDLDFAAWCTYKYLNGGPGSIAGAFVHERYAQRFDLPRFTGWWGHDKATRFEMGPQFRAIPGAEGWQLSCAPILSMAPVLGSLEIFHEAGIAALRAKSERLTGYLQSLLQELLSERIDILTPADPAQRGCQLSLRLRGARRQGRALFDELDTHGVICDWREPDVIRVAPIPLYNSFVDACRFVEILRELLEP